MTRATNTMEMTHVIDTVDMTLWWLCLWCLTDDELNCSLKRNTETSGQGGLSIGEWLGWKVLNLYKAV